MNIYRLTQFETSCEIEEKDAGEMNMLLKVYIAFNKQQSTNRNILFIAVFILKFDFSTVQEF